MGDAVETVTQTLASTTIDDIKADVKPTPTTTAEAPATTEAPTPTTEAPAATTEVASTEVPTGKDRPLPNPAYPFMPAPVIKEPPTKFRFEEEGKPFSTWYITESEYFRLNQLFGRDFQECGLGGTIVAGKPKPCKGCGKYTEFVDWCWTAIQRGVHSKEFIFNALKAGRQGDEVAHDVYCSQCGLLTAAKSFNKSEGGHPDIWTAGKLEKPGYSTTGGKGVVKKPFNPPPPPEAEIPATWGKWWIDDEGSTAKYREWLRQKKAEEKKNKAAAAEEGLAMPGAL